MCPLIPQFLLLSPNKLAPPSPQQLKMWFSFLARADKGVKNSLLKETLPVEFILFIKNGKYVRV